MNLLRLCLLIYCSLSLWCDHLNCFDRLPSLSLLQFTFFSIHSFIHHSLILSPYPIIMLLIHEVVNLLRLSCRLASSVVNSVNNNRIPRPSALNLLCYSFTFHQSFEITKVDAYKFGNWILCKRSPLNECHHKLYLSGVMARVTYRNESRGGLAIIMCHLCPVIKYGVPHQENDCFSMENNVL